MGIDVYLKWPSMTKAEEKKQITGWATDAGDRGYLREAYHGGPYVTKVLMPEGWDDSVKLDDDHYFELPAAVMRERLPVAVMTAIYRNHVVYEQGSDPGVVNVGDGEPGDVLIKELMPKVFETMKDASHKEIVERTTPGQREQAVKLIASGKLPAYAKAFVDFVELAEKMERKTGQPCRVCVSA